MVDLKAWVEGVVVRFASQDHLDDIVAFDPEGPTKDQLGSRLHSVSHSVYVALAGGDRGILVGWAACRSRPMKLGTPARIEIDRLWVRHTARRCGVGTKLIEVLKSKARAGNRSWVMGVVPEELLGMQMFLKKQDFRAEKILTQGRYLFVWKKTDEPGANLFIDTKTESVQSSDPWGLFYDKGGAE